MTLSAWVSEQSDKSIVITDGDCCLIFTHVHTVDVGSISTRWEDSVNAPSEFAVTGGPVGTSGVGGTTWVLGAIWHLEEQKLVGVTNGSNH